MKIIELLTEIKEDSMSHYAETTQSEISNFKRYEGPDGSWFQIRRRNNTKKPFYAIFSTPDGKQQEFDNFADLQDTVNIHFRGY